ncbi:MAG TPA: methyltransferase domain-containing protein [Gammaproteobacteria bacterium]
MQTDATTTCRDLYALTTWYEQPFGRIIKKQIAEKLTGILRTVPARELLHLGIGGFEETLAGRHRERVLFFTDIAYEHLLAEDENTLPLKSESQDCVVVLHGLDVAINPHGVLREVNRIMAKDGHLIIIGFNALSFWGGYRPLRNLWRWRKSLPWRLNFYTPGRLRDWLALLGYDVGLSQTFNYLPVIQNTNFQKRMQVLNSAGSLLLPWCGNLYVVVARKSTIPLTPVRLQWKQRRPVITSGVAEPV